MPSRETDTLREAVRYRVQGSTLRAIAAEMASRTRRYTPSSKALSHTERTLGCCGRGMRRRPTRRCGSDRRLRS